MFLRRRILPALFALCAAVPAGAKTFDIAVLVMAHGGSPIWNKTVMDTVKKAEIPYPTRVYFGMGHNREEVEALQSTVNYLQGKGAKTIVVVPLLVSSYSEVYRQWRYLLGKDVQPGFNTGAFPIAKRADIEFGEPFNDDPILALILLDRAREISQSPDQESVFLVAHGPNDDSDNARWQEMLQHLCSTIQRRGRFRSAQGLTLRDDAPPEIRSQAINTLRAQVEGASRDGGRALVIPVLIAPGGIENKIGIALKGIDYTLNGRVILPDNRIAQWIHSKIP